MAVAEPGRENIPQTPCWDKDLNTWEATTIESVFPYFPEDQALHEKEQSNTHHRHGPCMSVHYKTTFFLFIPKKDITNPTDFFLHF